MEDFPVNGRERERGAALISALLLLIMLTALGMAAIMTSTTETMIGKNDYSSKQVHYAAEAGIQEAMAKIDFNQIVPDATHYDTWRYDNYSAFRYIDYQGNQQAFMGYSVTVKYKKEGDYGDNFHYYSSITGKLVKYNRGFKYSSSPILDHALGQPVYTVRSLGIMYSGGRRSTAEIIVDCSENTLNVYPPGTITTNSCLQGNGSFNIAGGSMASYVSNCGSVSLPPPGTVSSTASPPFKTGIYTDMTGVNPYIGVKLPDLASMARDDGTYYLRTGPNSWNPPMDAHPLWGTSADPKIVYLDEPGQEFNLTGNVEGYGVLVVNGDLKITGTIDWYGLVYVTGNLDATLGTMTVHGGTMAGGSGVTKIGGNANLPMDLGALDAIAQKRFKQKQVGWLKHYN